MLLISRNQYGLPKGPELFGLSLYPRYKLSCHQEPETMYLPSGEKATDLTIVGVAFKRG